MDFYHRSVLRGYPPKVVWVALGNCSTDDVLARIQEALQDLPKFDDDDERSIPILR